PRKVVADIAGATMLERVVARVQAARLPDVVAVATTTEDRDLQILEIASRMHVQCTRGSENDVLARYQHAARELGADVIVRVTADCPLIDPRVIDLVISTF